VLGHLPVKRQRPSLWLVSHIALKNETMYTATPISESTKETTESDKSSNKGIWPRRDQTAARQEHINPMSTKTAVSPYDTVKPSDTSTSVTIALNDILEKRHPQSEECDRSGDERARRGRHRKDILI